MRLDKALSQVGPPVAVRAYLWLTEPKWLEQWGEPPSMVEFANAIVDMSLRAPKDALTNPDVGGESVG